MPKLKPVIVQMQLAPLDTYVQFRAVLSGDELDKAE